MQPARSQRAAGAGLPWPCPVPASAAAPPGALFRPKMLPRQRRRLDVLKAVLATLAVLFLSPATTPRDPVSAPVPATGWRARREPSLQRCGGTEHSPLSRNGAALVTGVTID
jgi:hypothetical protein